MLLENYGYEVNDLGKDVPAEKIIAAVKADKVGLVGLSALMTTTVHSMEETIKALRKECPECRIVVGGAVLTEELAKKIDKAIFPGVQGGPLMHIIAAKAAAFGEALTPEFKAYQEQIAKNAKAFAAALTKEGFRLVSGGTDNHLVLMDTRSVGLTGKVCQNLLDDIGITANKNTIPFDPQSPFVTSGVRLGTPAATTRGLVEEDFEEIAAIIGLVLKNPEDEAKKAEAASRVAALCAKYPMYPGLDK